MPSTIRNALARAIEARERCSEWCEKTKQSFDEGGHRHFISILKQALNKIDVVEHKPPKSKQAKYKGPEETGKEDNMAEMIELQ